MTLFLLLACVVADPALIPPPTDPPPAARRTTAEHDSAADTGASPIHDTGTVDRANPVKKPEIVSWPIVWDEERALLTVAYLGRHWGDDFTGDLEVDTTMAPRMVVLHWTGVPSARSTWNTFRRSRTRAARDLPDDKALNLSSHYLIDRDGTIFELLPPTRIGRHTIGLNHLAVGVENVGDGKRWPMTDAQVQANADLVRWLASEHDITHLIGHREYRKMESHPYFQELRPRFRTAKGDPGKAFMADVRALLVDLQLQGPPDPAG